MKNTASERLIEGLSEVRKEDSRLKDLLDKFDFNLLGLVNEYVISLGKNFLYGTSSLREFKARLDKIGYSTKLRYHQNPEDYELVITKTKLESGLGEGRFNGFTGGRK
ncbi:MAG TPA: hypothetical protein VJ208_03615 [Candidatus Nanoarchaeia archaeon]|nr:hypothetical protein [Candidatus Nanoarchaeia archaeon]